MTLDVGAAIGVIAAVIGLIVLIAVAWPVVRSKTTTSTIDLLRAELGIEREAREALEARCREDTAELRGQVHVLAGAFAKDLATMVANELARAVVDALGTAGVVERRDERRG